MDTDDADEERVGDDTLPAQEDSHGSDEADEERVGDATSLVDDITNESEASEDERSRSRREYAVEEMDGRIVDLLSWVLDTETRAKIYVYLLANPASTSEEVAKGTGLYPSTVREALAELSEEEYVSRQKRKSEGAGNNPYEYTSIQPSDLVGSVVDQVQQELNTIFTLDRIFDRGSSEEIEDDTVEPVTITVDSGPLDEPGSDSSESTDATDDPVE